MLLPSERWILAVCLAVETSRTFAFSVFDPSALVKLRNSVAPERAVANMANIIVKRNFMVDVQVVNSFFD